MEVVTIETNAFQQIQNDLKEIKDHLSLSEKKKMEDTWLTSKQVQKILGVSQRTWQSYRDKKLIRYAQIGQKIYVKASWLDDFIEDHAIRLK